MSIKIFAAVMAVMAIVSGECPRARVGRDARIVGRPPRGTPASWDFTSWGFVS